MLALTGLCALWVLLYHAWVYVTPQVITWPLFGQNIRVHVFLSLGWSGVQILFVLSAFLLTLPYARAHAGLASKPRVWRYLGRRIARLALAMFICAMLAASLSWYLVEKSR